LLLFLLTSNNEYKIQAALEIWNVFSRYWISSWIESIFLDEHKRRR
jgi:hypothetical protein